MTTSGTVTGIVMATRLEAAPFIDSGQFNKIDDCPLPLYSCGETYLIISGIGKAAAAIASTYLITRYNAEMMFNIGAAGSTTGDYIIGDILHIESVVEYDRPTLTGNRPRYLKPDILEGFNTATLATQDVAVVSAEHRGMVGKLASLVDMEGAGFIQACAVFNVKKYLFKIVTDTPSHTKDKEIIQNIKETRDILYMFFHRYLSHNSLITPR